MLPILKNKKYLALIFLAIAVVVVAFLRIKSNGSIETVEVTQGDIIRNVRIAGRITARDSVSLGFEIGGTVSQVSKSVGERVSRGEVIASLNRGSINADISKAEAELSSALAELAKLEGAGQLEAEVSNAKRNLIQSIVDAYTTIDDAIYNKTDQFFRNPRSGSPEILYAFEGYRDLRDSVNKERVQIGFMLDTWRPRVLSLSVENYTEQDVANAKKYLNQTSLFINDVSRAVNIFEANDSLNQATIDKYKNDVLVARESLNRASQNITTAEFRFRNLLAEVPIQVARVESARAGLESVRTQSSKTTIISPMNGTIARQELKVGQVVSAGTDFVSIISSEYVVEAFIPEISIVGLREGNRAIITLDAYRTDETLDALVSQIDPAETVKDGVSTYKTELVFLTPDERIRSGMTANVEIETFKKENVLIIPERVVVKENGDSFVYIYTGNHAGGKTRIILGERDSRGQVEVVEGLSLGQKLLLNPPRI